MMLGDGPMLSGHWYNPKTGDSFTVRDTFLENNEIVVMTTDGRRMNYDMISKYVQTDHPIKKQEFEKPKAQLPKEIQSQILPVKEDVHDAAEDLLLDEDKALLGVTVDPGVLEVKPAVKKVAEVTVEDEDDMLVRRMLKRSNAPQVKCSITWKDFPKKQMDMLDTMAVDLEKIADYYMKDIDFEQIRSVIRESIVKEIEKNLEVTPKSEVYPEDKQTGCTCVDSEGVKYLEQNGEVLVDKLEKVTPKKKPVIKKKTTTKKK